jgi:hypothetical protein
MEISKNQITDLLIGLTGLRKSIHKLDNAMEGEAFGEMFGIEMQMIQDTILSLCGVPDEETPFQTLGIDTSDYDEQQIEYGYCRDSIDEIIWNLADFEDDDMPTMCEGTIMAICEEWLPDENYITKRES